MANAKFDPVAQYPDYQPGAGSMLMKSLLAIQAHKDEQARQAALDKAHLAEQQSIQQQREQQMQEALIQHTINMHALEQKTALDQEIAKAAGNVGAAQAQAAGANQVANTQAAADMHGNAAQSAADMHGATTQALADMHGAGTQANADTNAANIAAATPAGEGAPAPKPAEVTPPPEPPALPQSESFLDKLTGRNLTLPFFTQSQQDAIEEDALKKKVHEQDLLSRAKEHTVPVIRDADGNYRIALPGEEAQAQNVPIGYGLSGLLNPRGLKATAPTTKNIGGREMGWNKDTGKFDIDFGPAGSPKDNTVANDNALQRSYTHAYDRVSKLGDAAQQKFEKNSNLVDALSQGTGAGDAIAIPQFISALAGGSGSGLRLTQAEINMVKSGRSALGNLEATWNKWTTGQQLTGKQRQEMLSLVQKSSARNSAALAAIEKAKEAISLATTPAQHRAALLALDKVYAAADAGVPDTTPAGGLHPTTKAGIDDLFSGKQ